MIASGCAAPVGTPSAGTSASCAHSEGPSRMHRRARCSAENVDFENLVRRLEPDIHDCPFAHERTLSLPLPNDLIAVGYSEWGGSLDRRFKARGEGQPRISLTIVRMFRNAESP